MTERDIHKLEKSARKMEESLVKADREYRDSNLKTEESRLSWEAAMYRCCRVSLWAGIEGVVIRRPLPTSHTPRRSSQKV